MTFSIARLPGISRVRHRVPSKYIFGVVTVGQTVCRKHVFIPSMSYNSCLFRAMTCSEHRCIREFAVVHSWSMCLLESHATIFRRSSLTNQQTNFNESGEPYSPSNSNEYAAHWELRQTRGGCLMKWLRNWGYCCRC